MHIRMVRAMASALLLATSTCGVALAQAAGPRVLPVDEAIVVNGVEVACTGIGQTRSDPRWAAYPVRVEFSNAANEYLVGGAITLATARGEPVLSVSCDAPWILLKLDPGAWRVRGWLPGTEAKPRSAPFSPPARGQMRLVLQFPDA